MMKNSMELLGTELEIKIKNESKGDDKLMQRHLRDLSQDSGPMVHKKIA